MELGSGITLFVQKPITPACMPTIVAGAPDMCEVYTVVTMPLMCSSSLSRQTGHVGSSVCPAGGVGTDVPSVLLMNSRSLTKTSLHISSGSREENCAPLASPISRGNLIQAQFTFVTLCLLQSSYRLVVEVQVELISGGYADETQEDHTCCSATLSSDQTHIFDLWQVGAHIRAEFCDSHV